MKIHPRTMFISWILFDPISRRYLNFRLEWWRFHSRAHKLITSSWLHCEISTFLSFQRVFARPSPKNFKLITKLTSDNEGRERKSELKWYYGNFATASVNKFSFFIYILIRIFAILTSPAVIRARTKSSHCERGKFLGNGFKSLSINIIGARLSVNYRHALIIRTIIESSSRLC